MFFDHLFLCLESAPVHACSVRVEIFSLHLETM